MRVASPPSKRFQTQSDLAHELSIQLWSPAVAKKPFFSVIVSGLFPTLRPSFLVKKGPEGQGKVK